uniref:CCHC-type domain-containing protein n=1 Tax=Oryzias latipes TaxID=8090 RepID=A0A3B3IAP2_ORYLA
MGQKRYELTMSNAVGRDKLLDGFKIGNTTVQGRSISNDELVVSFLGLPAYVTDEEILEKLEGWRVPAVSPIKRRMWPGTSVADGTRFVKVKFNESVQSLPYSAKFNTATGPEFFRVIHDKQVKVCRICIKPGHIVRDCPDFLCNKCGVQGHYARECVSSIQKCAVCLNTTENCVCLGAAEETVASDVSDSARDSASEEDLSDSVSDGRVSAARHSAAAAGLSSTEGGDALGRQADAGSPDLLRAAEVSEAHRLSTDAFPVREGEQHPQNAATPIRAGGAHGAGPAPIPSGPVTGGAQHKNDGSAPDRAGGAHIVGPTLVTSEPVEGGAQRRSAGSALAREGEAANLILTAAFLSPHVVNPSGNVVGVTDDEVTGSDMEVDVLARPQRMSRSQGSRRGSRKHKQKKTQV